MSFNMPLALNSFQTHARNPWLPGTCPPARLNPLAFTTYFTSMNGLFFRDFRAFRGPPPEQRLRSPQSQQQSRANESYLLSSLWGSIAPLHCRHVIQSGTVMVFTIIAVKTAA